VGVARAEREVFAVLVGAVEADFPAEVVVPSSPPKNRKPGVSMVSSTWK
jgi:hypothetical protein